MSDIKQRTLSIYEYLKELRDNDTVLQYADWFAFIVSLFPVPGLQQAGAIASKIADDRSISVRFSEIRTQIEDTNKRVTEIEDDIERLGAIANTVASVTDLQSQIEQFIKEVMSELERDDSEFVMDTSNWSIQAIINQMIDVDWVAISAKHHSQNILKQTKIQAKRTHLVADDHSINIIDGTDFSDGPGTVKMQGMGQTGHVSVTGNAVAFHGEGALIFGARPETVVGNCPSCNHRIEIEKHKLAGYSSITCPNCGFVSRFEIT